MNDLNPQIQDQLITDCQAFLTVANQFADEQFKARPDGKWSVADTMQHLYLSARPVARLMAGPREILLQWGEARQASRPYDVIAETYRQVLATGVKAPESMSPRPEDMADSRTVITERFQQIYEALVEAAHTWTDEELDRYVMPHPALGKLTVREMLDFTSIHTQHHLALLPVE
ncbi:DinB family protein [Spirosoma fluminis]